MLIFYSYREKQKRSNKMKVNIKVWKSSGDGCYGDAKYYEGIKWNLLKKDIKTKRFDGSFKMNNGDLVEIVK